MSSRPIAVLAWARELTPDLFTPALLERLRATCELPDDQPLRSFADARAEKVLASAEVLLTSWGCPPIDAGVLARAPRLRAIVHAAGTVKGHVGAECFARGLAVTSAAAANALPVAEYALATILLANKRAFRIQRRYAEKREFRWWPKELPGLGNYAKTVGVVGASFVGRRLIELLRPFDLVAQVADPFLTEGDAAALGVAKVELDDLLRTSDVVTLHAPALPETRHLIDRRRLALLRDGAVLINTARGSLVDGAALTDELRSGRIDAVIDTTDPEVLPADSALYDLPNVFLTPHVAGSMGTETQRMAVLAIEEIERFAAGQPFLHAIRTEDLPRIA
jgi:phosphoglycerate dehydrogenase-like enzyme